ncbi:IucA/IucC family siderophore biosynthesis protein, partial [Streptomyces prasinopilosus]
MPPPADDDAAPPTPEGARPAAHADAHASAPLLNCLLREVARPVPGGGADGEEAGGEEAGGGRGRGPDGPRTHRLPGTGRLLRVHGTRRPTAPEVRADDGTWRRLDHPELVELVAEELRRYTGVPNRELPAEMTGSRDAVAALLTARAGATPPADPYLRSEQSLLTGHSHHPAPKARGTGPASGWLPYAPEAYARFPLTLLGLREDTVVEEGDTSALDRLGTAPPGYRLLPAHPWQVELAGRSLAPAFADGRLVGLGTTVFPVWPTAAIRTVYTPLHDLFLKFSLDVRITNDVRRLWRHDLLRLRGTDRAAREAFAASATPGAPAAWLSDRGYRTADFAFEELAVLVRDGLHRHLPPGTTPHLAAALTEDYEGNPLAATTAPAAWWEAYLAQVVPPVLNAFARHGVVVEAHLQNTLIAVGADG